MKKKGFTLIELLAVIVILAVLALILTPMIQDLILNARKSAFDRSIDGILSAAEYYQIENPSDETIIFTCNGISCEDSNGHKLIFKGEVPISGTITISETGVVAENLCNQSFCGSGSKDNLIVNIGGGTSKPTVEVGTKWTFDYTDANVVIPEVIDNKLVYKYEYTGSGKRFAAPKTGTYLIELWGASGREGGSHEGTGAYTAGKITLNKDETLYVYVGQAGSARNSNGGATWNGGGSLTSCYGDGNNGTGGGATDIRLVPSDPYSQWNQFNSLKSRIMVAAGGGGFVSYSTGYAGGLKSYDATHSYQGTTWTGVAVDQTSGNALGKGADSPRASAGGGYFGGKTSERSGSGGSSYISGHTGAVALLEAATSSSLQFRKGTNDAACSTSTEDNLCSVHYSGKVFTDTVMIDGHGYNWTNVVGDQTQMPSPTGGYYSEGWGNSGNGYARITLLENFDSSGLDINSLATSPLIKEFIVPKTGTYKLEVWGAQGGVFSSEFNGGYGGYSEAEIELEKDTRLYIVVGEKGQNYRIDNYINIGGYNGGGNGGRGSSQYPSECGSGGGGATHIAIDENLGELKNYTSNRDKVLIVAGGGGGGAYTSAGSGGGYIGSKNSTNGTNNYNSHPTSNGGTQDSGYAFGLGQNGRNANNDYYAVAGTGGGGGGWYGGYTYQSTGSYTSSGGAGGSGYIGSDKLSNAKMVCYNCAEDRENQFTYTETTTCTELEATAECAKQGNGYAKITYIR